MLHVISVAVYYVPVGSHQSKFMAKMGVWTLQSRKLSQTLDCYGHTIRFHDRPKS